MRVALVIVIGAVVILIAVLVFLAIAILGAHVWTTIYQGRGRDE